MRSKLMRGLALAGSIALTMGLAACGSDDDNNAGQQVSITAEAEVFTWWAEGSEKAGLDALVSVMRAQNPTIMFVNAAVSGGAGSNAKDVLADRLAAYNPPDSFQAHAGLELTDYITNGQVRDISFLYDEFGLRDALPQDLLDLLTVNGKIYSIPVNVHRANMLWANPTVLKDAGLDPKATYKNITEWIKALEKVKAAGKIPLSVGENWTQVQLFESVLLSDLGAEAYVGLWDGSTAWTSAAVTDSLENFEKIMSLTNDDRDEMSWPAALKLVQDGKAAFNLMGDWAAGELEDSLGSEILAYPVPGSDGVFNFLADSFTLPVGAPNAEGSRAWLEAAASLEGQVAFNRAKGSIPARTDADPAEFSEYQQSAIADFASDTIVPSLAHGAAASPTQLAKIASAVEDFTTGATTIQQFQTALAASGS
ncbi:glucose/mannose transport system substrate-binding protein [Micrococcales bacterium KH10]|nr:glucose/mannose transport system substrate-binding protein [Micrococcales bacterium KH10]